jgi:hypothetical protein
MRNYGLSVDEYAAILDSQSGGCGICGAKVPGGNSIFMHVDHCHATGKIRGLLCTNCNRGLGYFQDDIEVLAAAIRYLG